ncbi:MAG TPA: FG-GAP-like repeat-containing protein [Saprospiraceae bacterium]|nr:FG-GAP-like repeat-containing protein [Saprospiraceae bacterium]
MSVLLSHPATSQSVSFVHLPQLLNGVSGFTGYSDCAVDMNSDRLDDVVRTGNKGLYIDYQQPDGSFVQLFFPVPIASPPSWSICAGDIDNNGYNDLLFGHLGTVSFLHANDNGSEYAETLMPGFIVSQRSTLADINNDGWLDGFVCNDTARSVPYRNDGDGHMTPDIGLVETADLPGSYAAIWVDYDNDRDTDLYLTKCLGGAPPTDVSRINLLYRNNGDGTFTEVGQEARVDDNAQSWSTVFEDFDNDGDFDAFIVNHDMQNRLYRNNADGTFTDVIAGSGIDASDLGAWENASGDFNNDGFVDIFSELSNELYLGKGDLTFTGQNALVTPGAIADLNNDGFLDVSSNGQVWLNEGNQYHWVKVIPRGISSNRSGIGARIEIFGPWGKQIREIRSGQSYSPMSSLTAHFGLGQNDFIDSLKISWPSGMITKVYGLDADSTYFIPEAPCLLPGNNTISLSGDPNICPGDTIFLTAPGGYEQYLWPDNRSDAILPVHKEGNYYVISFDNEGCAKLSQPIEILFHKDSPPTIFSPGGNIICQNDSLELISTPGTNHIWSDGTTGTPVLLVSESGTYSVSIDAMCSEQPSVSEPFQVTVLSNDIPEIISIDFLPGDTIILTADRSNCTWYDVPFGGDPLFSGPVFKTKAQGQLSTYFLESNYTYTGVIETGGKPDTSGPGGLSNQAGYLLFTSWAYFTLHSVDILIPDGTPLNNRFVQLWKGDSLIAFKQFAVVQGVNTLNLDFHIEPGNYTLRSPQGLLWRNTGNLGYPYPIGDEGSITTSSFGDQFYYYFYNWKIETDAKECISERVKVEVMLTSSIQGSTSSPLHIFPNPSSETIYVELSDEIHSPYYYVIANPDGKIKLGSGNSYSNPLMIDISSLVPGLYVLQIVLDHQFASARFIKE